MILPLLILLNLMALWNVRIEPLWIEFAVCLLMLDFLRNIGVS
jgi:hypothetical protein